MKVPRLHLPSVVCHFLLLLSAVGPAVAQTEADKDTKANHSPLRALILSGGGRHDWRATTPFLRRLLEAARFEVKVCETPVGLTPEALSPFDVIIDDYSGERLGRPAEQAVEAFVESGKGLVVIHDRLLTFASAASDQKAPPGDPSWTRFSEMTKAFKTNAQAGEAGARTWFPVKLAKPEHPVILGLKEGQKTADRPCTDFTLDPKTDVLLTTETGQPLVFTSTFGQGRVFATALGCDLAAMQEKLFGSTLARGAEWAATGQVTLPAEMETPESKAPAIRLLVITGGHDHEASFYRLFEDQKEFGWVPVSDSKTAFQQDLRGKYDVLVLYDFSRDLDDKGKENLRAFVESGKGIVVLHHAVLNYQKWPWWFEEVVGGRYRLQHEGDIPNSTVKMGEEHWITPAGPHPITDGVGPFHVTDETYRGLWISPKIQPLLKTTNRTSDPVVGWIGPCTTSRVVYLQLGHDHSPFRHPAYQALVRNSILWSAGKL